MATTTNTRNSAFRLLKGLFKEKGPVYCVHIGPDPEAVTKRFKDAGYPVEGSLFVDVSRINRMNPNPDSKYLEMFKDEYRQFKSYFLAPGVLLEDGKSIKPLFELSIYKGRIHFRYVTDIGKNDVDSSVLR
jgi:hypothetical protein